MSNQEWIEKARIKHLEGHVENKMDLIQEAQETYINKFREIKEIYRFRNINYNSISDFCLNKYWLSLSYELNDPFENFYQTLSFEPYIKESDPIKSACILKEIFLSDEIYSCSFTENIKSKDMWSHYADGYKGFAIGYDPSRLIAYCDDYDNNESTTYVPFPILYVKDVQQELTEYLKILSPLINKTLQSEPFNEFKQKVTESNNYESLPYSLSESLKEEFSICFPELEGALSAFRILLQTMKTYPWKGEQEWRLIKIGKKTSDNHYQKYLRRINISPRAIKKVCIGIQMDKKDVDLLGELSRKKSQEVRDESVLIYEILKDNNEVRVKFKGAFNLINFSEKIKYQYGILTEEDCVKINGEIAINEERNTLKKELLENFNCLIVERPHIKIERWKVDFDTGFPIRDDSHHSFSPILTSRIINNYPYKISN